MKSNHTQGEWKAEILDKSLKVLTDDYVIADVIGFNKKANARLIAAAPDMLSSIIFSNDILMEVADLDLPSGVRAKLLKAMLTLQQTIRKAEGNI